VLRRSVIAIGSGLALVGCGSADEAATGYDDASVRAIVEDIARDPSAMCAHLSGGLSRELGGAEGCARVVPAGAGTAAGVEVDAVEVEGDRATARYDGRDGEETLVFVREAGAWRLAGG
jgi:hypothetical protein